MPPVSLRAHGNRTQDLGKAAPESKPLLASTGARPVVGRHADAFAYDPIMYRRQRTAVEAGSAAWVKVVAWVQVVACKVWSQASALRRLRPGVP